MSDDNEETPAPARPELVIIDHLELSAPPLPSPMAQEMTRAILEQTRGAGVHVQLLGAGTPPGERLALNEPCPTQNAAPTLQRTPHGPLPGYPDTIAEHLRSHLLMAGVENPQIVFDSETNGVLRVVYTTPQPMKYISSFIKLDTEEVDQEKHRVEDAWAASPWSEFFEMEDGLKDVAFETKQLLLRDPDATRTFVELVTEYAQRLASASTFLQTRKRLPPSPLSGILLEESVAVYTYRSATVLLNLEPGVQHNTIHNRIVRCTSKRAQERGETVLGYGDLPSRLYELRMHGTEPDLQSTANAAMLKALTICSEAWVGNTCERAGLKDPHEPLYTLWSRPDLEHLRPRYVGRIDPDHTRLGRFFIGVELHTQTRHAEPQSAPASVRWEDPGWGDPD